MPTTTPTAAFAAVVRALAPSAYEARHMVQHGGQAAVTVGRAVVAALKAGKDDSEAGCGAFLKALAPAADEARDLAKHGNDRQKQVSRALLAAQHDAAAVDWHPPPAEQPVAIAAAFGDLTLSADLATPAAVRLERAGATDLAASCGWQATGAGAARLARAAGPAVFAVGAADVDLGLEFAPAPGMRDAETVVVAIVGPFLGLRPGAPASVTRRLLPPVVAPPRPVVIVAQGFDAVALSASAPTTGQAVLARTGDTSAALIVPLVVSGLQDGDLAQPVGPARFAAGAAQATVTLQFDRGTAGAPDRAAHLAIDASGGAFDAGVPTGFDFTVREPAVVVVPPPTVTLTGPGDITPSATAEVDAAATVALSAPTDHDVTATYELTGQQDGDLLSPASGPVTVPAGQPSVPVPIRVAPLGLSVARPLSLALSAVAGAAAPFPPPVGFSLLADAVVRQGGPPPIDPASHALQAQADPSSFSRVTNGLKPGTAVLLAPGHYGFTNIHVPGCLYYAAVPGTVFVDGRVELHTPDTAVLLLDIGGGIVLDGDRARASRCVTHGSSGVDLVSAQGADNVVDWCEISDFAGIGVGVQAKSARRPVMYGLHVHSQRASGPPSSGTVFMIGHSHVDSDQPVQGRYERILMEGARSHDGFEIKSSDNTVVDVTAVGCDVMQRHGLRAATFLSCWAEAEGGKGGRIQLNANRPKAVRCHGRLAVAAGNGSEADVLAKTSASGSIYPYADGAEVHHHDGPVEIGNLYGPDRHLPPVGTLLDACPVVRTTAGTYAPATPIPPEQLPPAARRLTPADVGPGGA